MRTVSLLLLCLLPALAAAQDDSGRDDAPRTTVSVWSGVSFESPGWWGAVRGREFFILGLRYQHTVTRSSATSLAYTLDLIPAAVVTKTPSHTASSCCLGFFEDVVPGTAFGVGIAPLGLQLELFRENPVYLALGLAGGVLWFDRDVPRVQTRKMNFTAELSAGLRYPIADDWALTVGYKFHHLSNAGTGTFNPGLDANVFYLGWGRR